MDQIVSGFNNNIFIILLIAVATALFYAMLGEINKRLFDRQRWEVLVAAVVLIAVAAFWITQNHDSILRFAGRLTFWSTSNSGRPVVIGIYPEGGFGTLHKQGLHAALERNADVLDIVDLTATYEAMKTNQASHIAEQLRKLITTRNVVAIVGPPVTEFTETVIRTVYLTGRRPPVFITSAAPRGPIGWNRYDVPLYRINSGIDERAEEFASFATLAVQRGVRLVFLVETGANAEDKIYGSLVLHEIVRRLPDWNDWVESGDKITLIKFRRGKAGEELADREDAVLDETKVIMLLGVGDDYADVVQEYFKASDPRRRAVFGGWMNAYRVESLYRKGRYQWPMLLELTDIQMDRIAGNAEASAFESRFGRISPANRDRAFSFDAGSVVASVFARTLAEKPADAQNTRIDDQFHAAMVTRLSTLQIRGITGPIKFNRVGQNVGLLQTQSRRLTYTIFDGATMRWRPLSGPEELLDTLARSAEPH